MYKIMGTSGQTIIRVLMQRAIDVLSSIGPQDAKYNKYQISKFRKCQF